MTPERIVQVKDQAALARFVTELLEDWQRSQLMERESPAGPWSSPALGWENPTLDRFLEAMAAYVDDAKLSDPPTWATFAQILAGAKIYE